MNYYERLDKGCKAFILADAGDRVLIDARWKATRNDDRRFRIEAGIARNITYVSKRYFEQKYGVKL